MGGSGDGVRGVRALALASGKLHSAGTEQCIPPKVELCLQTVYSGVHALEKSSYFNTKPHIDLLFIKSAID